jgi:hypothetical protein
MHYRINHSLDPTVTGKPFAQTIFALDPGPVTAPNHFRNIFLRKVDDLTTIIIPKPILEKKAKLTDLISGSSVGSSTHLIISKKLKDILASAQHDGLQFFPTAVIYKGDEIADYWLTHPHGFDYQYIDFKKSVFSIRGLGGVKVRNIEITDLSHFNATIQSSAWPEGIQIEYLFLKAGITQDLVLIRWVWEVIGYYVSEKLKKEIEDAGCTGIVFTKPEVRFP